ncbi:MAG: hypothetical protein ACYS18_12995 [Planctomycetota bacterium]|jgi:hypothetical protein
MAKKKKKKVGRPTKYKKAFCNKLIEFFDAEPYEKIELPHYQADGETLKWMDYKIVPARMPTLRKFAKLIKVHVSNVYEWVNIHKEFRDAFTLAKEIRKEWLIDLGLSGLTPPLAYKFTAINVTDMVDAKVVESRDDDKLTAEEKENLRKILKARQAPLKLVKGA